ncbi:MAG: hypothetical protein HZB55_17175 [Deltaproteobacteria bacterium]|nr:hypothetical protein [Deltaproteobacteria bacterium]
MGSGVDGPTRGDAEGTAPSEAELSAGLSVIRRRRWYLWAVLLTYLPAIWLSLEITESDRKTAVVFGVWVAMAAVAGAVVAAARCPRCGNYFHLMGLMPVWVRKCLHCGLGLTVDKRAKGGPAGKLGG